MRVQFDNCIIGGIASCVPSQIVDNANDHGDLEPGEVLKTIELTGVQQYRKATPSECASDLCEHSAQRLLRSLCIDPKTLQGLLFVTQSPDYKTPSTACLLQNKLGLPLSSLAFDINLGCSGFVYGLFTACSMLQNAGVNRILLCCGDTQTKLTYPKDKNVNFLLGDGGAAILVEKQEDGAYPIRMELFTDGSRYDKLMIPAGGCRTPSTEATRTVELQDDGQMRSQEHLYLAGIDIFAFSAIDVVRSLKNFIERNGTTVQDYDFLCLHQANKFMTDKVGKKIGFSPEQILYSLSRYGNTSNASIPITMCHEWHCRRPLSGKQRLLTCGFGIGLSWGIVEMTVDGTTFLPVEDLP